MKKTALLIVGLSLLAPAAYLWIVWPHLPATVPMHYDLNGNVDRYGSKNELWVLTGVLSGVALIVYLLFSNVHRLNAKLAVAENKERMQKIGLAVTVFIAVIQIWLVYVIGRGEPIQYIKFVLAAVGFLFAVIGNYMPNLKPNYVAGLRMPWTLENADNWRKTHQLAGKIWFAGGLLAALLCLLLPLFAAGIAMMVVITVMILIPAVYSYRLYKKSM